MRISDWSSDVCSSDLVIVCDLTAEMLAVGRDRAVDRGLVKGLSWVCGDAERLPLPDRSVAAYTIAFGLRNVTYVEHALAEARRALRPGGRFLCLEFSRVVVPRSEEHTSEIQSQQGISHVVFQSNKKK